MRPDRLASAWVIVVATLAALACTNETPARRAPPPPADPIDPAVAGTQVRSFFAAIEGRDCSAIVGRLPGVQDAEECAEFLEDAEHHGLHLIDVVDSQVDGRDPRSAVVRVGVQKDGRPRQIMIRATLREGRWTFVL